MRSIGLGGSVLHRVLGGFEGRGVDEIQRNGPQPMDLPVPPRGMMPRYTQENYPLPVVQQEEDEELQVEETVGISWFGFTGMGFANDWRQLPGTPSRSPSPDPPRRPSRWDLPPQPTLP